MRVLITAGSRHGSTREIAGAIGEVMSARGLEVTVMPPSAVRSVGGFDAVVIGSAVYAGHWVPEARQLMERVGPELAHRPVWLFSSGPVGNPSGRLVAQMAAEPAELAAIRAAVHPRDHRTFPGRLDGRDLPLLQRAAARLFRVEGDFRDWAAVRAWAYTISTELLASASA